MPLHDVLKIEFEGVEFANDDEIAKKHDPHHVLHIGKMTINGSTFHDIIFIHTTKCTQSSKKSRHRPANSY